MADPQDDLLDPTEIDALLQSTTGSAAAGSTVRSDAGAASDLLSGNEIDSLLQQRDLNDALGRAPAGLMGTEELLERAEAGVAMATAPDLRPPRMPNVGLDDARPFEFEQFENAAGAADSVPLTALQEVELDLRIELGRTELLIDEVLRLREGSVVPLDKLAGDPVDILVNGRLIARGEVLVLNDNFCVRVAEILAPSFP